MLPEVNVIGQTQWSKLKPLDTTSKKLVQVPGWTKFDRDTYEKRQVVLHHTVSGPGITGDLTTWKKYGSDIGTSIIIDRDGTIRQLFPTKFWAYHLGVKGGGNLDKHSIGIELDNWGQLKEKDGKHFTIYNTRVKVPVTEYKHEFRGESTFESYTEAQIESLGELLLYFHKEYDIPLDYKEDMWDLSDKALAGNKGVWAHVSYRPWPSKSNKWDAHPQPELIEMLKTLKNLV